MKSLIYVFIVLTISSFVSANNLSVEDRLAKLEEALLKSENERQALKAEVTHLKSQIAVMTDDHISRKKEINKAQNEAVLERMVAEIVEKETKDIKFPQWLNNTKFFGDFRYRYEWTDDHANSGERDRHRIRARLGLIADINHDFKTVFRVASGNSESPTGANQDLGSAFKRSLLLRSMLGYGNL